MIRISPEKISYFLKKYHFWILGLILFLLLSFSAFIYYKNVYLVINTQVESAGEEITIDEYILGKIMGNIEERENNLFRVETKNYYNPFKD
ncbi:hypothetical protein KKH07_00630 [Patescibacteria group bacterium]|nr:hypothetical protein [Patescibacteria group bacterium]MBU1563598.1 hypothetical protein [Patescibacteria group bacterium]